MKSRNIHPEEQDLGLLLDAEPATYSPHMSKGLTPTARQALNGDFLKVCGSKSFATILADPPWQFQNRTGKIAPEHRRLNRYSTMNLDDIMALPVARVARETAHLYLWVPNALLPDGLQVLAA